MAALAAANLPATPLLFHAFYLPLVLRFTSRQVKPSKRSCLSPGDPFASFGVASTSLCVMNPFAVISVNYAKLSPFNENNLVHPVNPVYLSHK